MPYFIDSVTLHDLIKTGQQALKGASNDAEHDALYEIVSALEALEPAVKKESNRAPAKSP